MELMTIIISAAKYTFGAFILVVIVSYIISKVKGKNKIQPMAVEKNEIKAVLAPVSVKKISEAPKIIDYPEKKYHAEKKYTDPKLVRRKEEYVSPNVFVKAKNINMAQNSSRYSVVNQKNESLAKKNYVAFL